MNSEPDVHSTHCCKAHGCKYGQASCSVVQGQQVQTSPCEDCKSAAIQVTQIQERLNSLTTYLAAPNLKEKVSDRAWMALQEAYEQLNTLAEEINKIT